MTESSITRTNRDLMDRIHEFSAKMALMNEFRMLWEQHGAWTRMAIQSIVQNSPDQDLVIQRLLRNPKDFAEVLEPFYGISAADQFSALLTDHLVIAADLVKAAQSGNTIAADAAEKKWYENADSIATLLGKMNPYWSAAEWKTMLHEHLRLVKQEAVDLINQDYQKGIDTYDEIERQGMEMADSMSSGIIRQFPYI